MKRIIAGVLIAPLAWPWIFVPVSVLAYDMLTGSPIEYSWDAPLYNLQLLWWAYGLMAIFGCPFVYFSVRRHLRTLWSYVLAGTLIGLAAPVLVDTIVFVLQLPTTEGRGLVQLSGMLESQLNLIAGTTVASGAMFVAYWAIGVRGNAAYGAAI